MSDIKNLLESFDKHKEDLKEMGSELVKKYPQSKNLLAFVTELDAAVQGLDSLRDKLDQVLSEAEMDHTLAEDLGAQMDKDPMYKELADGDRKKLLTYLIDNHAGLVDDEQLLSGLESSLGQKSDEALIAEFPKKHIMDLGKEADPEADDFGAYKAGTAYIKQQLADSEAKAEIVKSLAKGKFEEDPQSVVKEFYSKAFETKVLEE